MRPDLVRAAEAIFNELVDVPATDRPARLSERCAGEGELRAFVERLLANHDRGFEGFLESPAFAMTHTGSSEEIPEQIGRYRIIRKIGEGGMGVVFEARQDSPARTVALKAIRPGLTSGLMLRRFQLEAEVLGQLTHPGIAHIYDAGTAEVRMPGAAAGHQQPFFAMEYVHGSPLNAYVIEHSLSSRERLELIARIADAVQHAHQHGVIHRDLKPGNILVPAAGPVRPASRAVGASGGKSGAETLRSGPPGLPTPKVLDFGVARLTGADVQTMTLQTGVGQLIGTLPYMSPEQVAGDSRQVDTRSDVYSLGVILYEVLAGRLPYDVRNRSIPEAARVIREEEPSRLSTVNVVFRGDVETIVSRAIEKDKERRYQSAEQFAADIRRYLRDEPIVARPPSAWYQVSKFARRNKALVGGAVTAFVALLIAAAGMTWFALRESGERRRAEEALAVASRARDAEKTQRDMAERRFDEVRALARTVIYDIHDEIADLPGATKAREALVRTALKYLDGLAVDAGGDPRLLKELALAYERMGDVQGRTHKANMGDTAGALSSYEKALAHARAMVDIRPDDAGELAVLADIYSSVGQGLRAIGKSPQAISAFEKGREAARRAAQLKPGDEDIARTAAIADANIAQMQLFIGQYQAALDNFERYREYIRRAHDAQPEDRTAHFNLALAESKVGDLLSRLDRDKEARAAFDRALALAEDLAAKTPGDARNVALLASMLKDNGSSLLDSGQPAQALPMFDRMLEIQQRLASDDPKDFRARRNLAAAHYMRGLALEKLGRLHDALRSFEADRDLVSALAAADPNYVVVERDLALALLRCGALKMMLKQYAAAREDLQSHVRQIEKLLAKDPTDATTRKDLGLAHYAVGHLEVAIGNDESLPRVDRIDRYRRAIEAFERTIAVYLQMKEDGVFSTADEDELRKTRNAIKACQDGIVEVERGPATSAPTTAPTTPPRQ